MLYKDLNESIPEFKEIAPYDSLSYGGNKSGRINIFVPVNPDSLSISMKLGIPSADLFSLEETLGYLSPIEFLKCTSSYYQNSSSRKLKNFIQLKSLELFKFVGKMFGFPAEGDFKMNLFDKALNVAYIFVINHRKESAKLLFKESYSDFENAPHIPPIRSKVKLNEIHTYLNRADVQTAFGEMKIKAKYPLFEQMKSRNSLRIVD